MPHLRLASEIEFPDGLLDGQMRDEWQSLKALGDSVRKNLKLRPLTAEDDEVYERPDFLSPTAPPANAIAAMLGPVERDLSGVLAMRDALLLDTRAPDAYAQMHVPGSVNVYFMSIKLKRLAKPGALADMAGLYPYIASEAGRATWDTLMKHWDGSVVVLDHDMDPKNPGAQLLSIIQHLPDVRATYFLGAGLASCANDPRLVRSAEQPPPLLKKTSRQDLSQRIELLTSSPDSATLPELDPTPPPHNDSSSSGYLSPPAPARSPSLNDLSPSPSPSSTTFSLRARNRAPKLTRLDTKSTERLAPSLQIDTYTPVEAPPKLSLHTQGRPPATKAATVPLRPLNLRPPGSPSFLATSPASPAFPRSPSPRSAVPPTPGTVRPTAAVTPSEFEVSTILPGFLYLGPEPTTHSHVKELQALGVKRIISVAVECDDDQGLELRRKFDKYFRVPMRDTVEEENVGRGARDVCAFLDDARLHSSPTYVHCKAGKSRSVTMVMAYLIHANHWPLWRAYAFVHERRSSISPNIGFVSELMNFEERSLGTKSVGATIPPDQKYPDSHNTSTASVSGVPGTAKPMNGHFAHLVGGRKGGQMRESLPPAFSMPPSEVETGEQVEVRDAEGRYRHARRAPVDESTLQPSRRVSKAGLEVSKAEGGW